MKKTSHPTEGIWALPHGELGGNDYNDPYSNEIMVKQHLRLA